MSSKNSENNKTLKELLAEFDELAAWFDSADLDIEAATAKFAEGQKLATEIREKLSAEKNKIELVKQNFARGDDESKSVSAEKE